MSISRKIIGLVFLCCGVATLNLAAQAGTASILDPSLWTAIVRYNNVTLPYPAGITAEDGGLRFEGFYAQPGDKKRTDKRAQYTIPNSVFNTIDKVVNTEVVFDGEFVDVPDDQSFIGVILRGNSQKDMFNGQVCYTILFKNSYIIVQKWSKGTSTYDQVLYSKFSKLGFKNFPAKIPLKLGTGIVTKDGVPRFIVRINDIEILNLPDNRNSLTIKANPDSVFGYFLVGTNKEIPGSTKSGSSLLIKSISTE